jgi:hypothetical protein
MQAALWGHMIEERFAIDNYDSKTEEQRKNEFNDAHTKFGEPAEAKIVGELTGKNNLVRACLKILFYKTFFKKI